MNKTSTGILASIAMLIYCLFSIAVYAEQSEAMDLQGHRGARGLRPENTLPAFEYCVDQRMTTIELDTALTRDKQLIIHHDTVLNPKICVDSQGVPVDATEISSLSVNELKTLDCGALQNEKFPRQVTIKSTRLMTLDEFFNRFRDTKIEGQPQRAIQFNIEIKFNKDPPPADIAEAAAIMVKTIENAGMAKRATVQSFELEVLPEIKSRNRSIKTSALFVPTKFQGLRMMMGLNANRDDILQKAIDVKADVISPYYLYANREFVETSHRHKMKVIPWTVNEEATMIDLFTAGVDGVISDYPALLYSVYQNWLKSR